VANRYGDIELDVRGMRALAHPARLAILTHLQKHGANTATGLSTHVGATPSVTSWHLRHLAHHGLVRDAEQQGNGRERWWEAAARGFRVVVEDEAGRRAARALRDALDQTEGDQVADWRRDDEPHLDLAWLALSGLANTTILVTQEELAGVEDAIEALLAPYVLRKDAPPDEVPDGARMVRIRRHVLPRADRSDGPS
jgi:DNA-binding transcriptional ArsR family regulator